MAAPLYMYTVLGEAASRFDQAARKMALAKAQPVLIEAMTYRGGHHRFALLLLTL